MRTTSARRAAVLAGLVGLASAVAAPARAQRRDASAARAFDVLDYDVTVELPDSGRTFGARAVLAVRRLTPGAATLALDLAGLAVDSVLVDGRPATFVRDSTTLRVALPPRGDTMRVAVRYGGTPSDGLGLARDAAGRWAAFADNWPRRAHRWLPSVDWPDDKATVTWTVRAPAGRTIIANGALVRETMLAADAAHAARTESVWRESHPIPTYLMVIAAAPLVRRDLVTCDSAAARAGCVAQAAYVAPEVADFLPGPFARVGDIVRFFTALAGPFPYEKLAHVQSSTSFGGMENASAIFYADAPYRDRSMTDGVVAHETAHQWFGDAVTERDFADLWLSEGFATYFAALWTRESRGDSAFRAEMAEARRRVLASAASRTRPVRDTAQTEYMQLLNTNSYQKGGWVLHMLRAEVGDSAFVRGVREYYGAHRDGNATTADLRAAMEHQAGRPLAWFFDQWLTRAGTPAFTLARVAASRSAPTVAYEVRQTSARPYAFPLTVRARETGALVTVRVPAERTARVRLPAGALDVDPEVALLAATPEVTR